MMKNINQKAKNALLWIVEVLQNNNIPFQITGGLAAKLYGSKRPLIDIDIDIPEDCFEKLKNLVSKYLTYGPERFINAKWDLELMTLDYHGQLIDLSGAFTTKIFDEKQQQWVLLGEDLSNTTIFNLFDKKLPVIPKDRLIFYKKILSRDEDKLDLLEINN